MISPIKKPASYGKKLVKLSHTCSRHDEDGIDVYFLNHLDSPLVTGFEVHVTQATTIITYSL